MDQNRWKTVNQIFHAALELSSSERRAFVITASEGDPELQTEVELLLKADQDAGSYIESPLVPEGLFSNFAPPMNPGDVLCGRFRIVRAIAEGGMGNVFEAFDSELSVRVALKVIRQEIASSPEALARFRQEVRLARQITHPNVCRTFDIERETLSIDPALGKRWDVIFLTMEFLEGETLASRIKRAGRLSLDESLHIARQIADALQAAHSLGIVHRDIKPANIMLVPGENTSSHTFRTVITDFGLARLDPLVSSGNLSALSHTARPIGTLAYMAPEQLAGSQVSAVTDIYAFGLVLFEAVTGVRAFPSDNLLSGITQRLAGPPPAPQSLVPNLPTPWCRAIEGCLRSNPADRFQSAADVIAVLDGGRIRLRPVTAALRRRSLFSTWPRSRRIAAFSLAVLAAVALLGGVLRYFLSRADARVAPGTLIYLTPVKNETGDKAFDNLTELIQAGLAQSVQVNLLDQGRVGDILEHMTKAPDTPIDAPTAREIAMRAGAVRVVFATVTGSAGSYKLNIDIQQPDNDPGGFRDHWQNTYAWTASGPPSTSGAIPAELLTKMRAASDWIRHEVGESANDIARLDTPPEDVTTTSWQALSDYDNAETLAAHHKREEAVTFLQAAVREDPNFALAYARLGDILVNLLHTSAGDQAYISALDVKERSRLSLRERNRIQGLYSMDTDDFQTSEEMFRLYSSLYERDYLGWFYRAHALSMLGRSPEAVEVLKMAHQIAPERAGAISLLVTENLILDNMNEANRWMSVLKQNGDRETIWFTEGVLEFIKGELSNSAKSFASLAGSDAPTVRVQSVRYLADIAAEQGQFKAAANMLTESMSGGQEDAPRLFDRAYLDGMTGHVDQAIADIEHALQLDDSPQSFLRASTILGRIAFQKPGAEVRLASDELEILARRLPREQFGVISLEARYRTQGEWLLAKGEPAEALQEFRKADSLEAPAISREYLGRALEALAAQQPTSSKSRQLLSEALNAYSSAAMHPAVIWQLPTEYPPGVYADALQSWLRVARQLKIGNDLRKAVEQKLTTIRPSAQQALDGGLTPDRSRGIAPTLVTQPNS